jgi:hypothetical protein
LATKCLTDDEIASLQDVPPGEAPGELAQHLAGCERCQARALFGAARHPGVKREPPQLPSLSRALGLFAILILAIAAFFWTLRRLAGSE